MTKRLLAITTIGATLCLAACGDGDIGLLEAAGSGGDVGTLESSLRAQMIANTVILKTRPRATELLVSHVNIVLASHNILDTVVNEVESRILDPLTDGTPTNTCPYLTKSNKGANASCRYLVDRAVEEALVYSPALQASVDQDVDARFSPELGAAEVAFVKGWANEAVYSGIDVGAVQAVEILRGEKVCDQDLSPEENAFKLGEEQGKALLEQTENKLLPSIPRTICNTDTVAATILAEAKEDAESYRKANPICDGFSPYDLAEAVDLAKAEKNRADGLEEGLWAAYEALRVRLVSTWVCVRPPPPPDSSGDFSGGGFSGGFSGGGFGDPLVIDLAGSGVVFSGRRAAFDLAATGDEVQVPVLGASSALLAIDLDGNGRIDSGAELLGNASSCGARRCLDGIEALAQHDSNGDGRIDAKDPVYSRLLLWQDANADGQSSSGELTSLAQAGIHSISLTGRLDRAWADAEGNTSLRAVSFERADGSAGTIYDVWFSVSFEQAPRDPRATGIVSTLRERAGSGS